MPRSPMQSAAKVEGRGQAPKPAAPPRHWLRLSMMALFAAPLVLAVLQFQPGSMNEVEVAPDCKSTPSSAACSKAAADGPLRDSSSMAVDPDVSSGASLISSSKVLGVGPTVGGMDPFSELMDESEEAMLAIDEDAPEELPSAKQQSPKMSPFPALENRRAKQQATWLFKVVDLVRLQSAPMLYNLGVRLQPWLLLFLLIVGGHQWLLYSTAGQISCPEDTLDEFEDLDEPITDLKLKSSHRTEPSDECGCTALHVAAHNGDVATAKTLLDGGSDVNAREAWDETPLHFAARRGSAEICSLLLNAGADVNASNEAGATPLIEAARACQEPACVVLLDHGGHAGGLMDDKVPPMLGALLAGRILAEAAAALPTATTSD